VAGHIFQARPVWIYTQSNITNIVYSPEYTTPTQKKYLSIYQKHCLCAELVQIYMNIGRNMFLKQYRHINLGHIESQFRTYT
jgi:hypothetical protein